MSGRRLASVVLTCLSLCVFAGTAHAAPYSSHSQMNSCCTSSATKEAMFREAKATGAAYIRVGINVPAIFFPERYGNKGGLLSLIFKPKPTRSGPDWSGTDQVARLSRKYQLPVLGVLLGSSEPAASCPASVNYHGACPPRDPRVWASQVGAVAARYRGTIANFEIWNEPDSNQAFADNPAGYGRVLSDSYDAIKARSGATVVLGGTMYSASRGQAFLDNVFRTRNADASHKFDIAAMHLRGSVADMLTNMRRRNRFLKAWGRQVPMWVTEHGYPSDRRWQLDLFFRNGDQGQAQYLSESLPALALAGARQIFVTLGDQGPGPFASEGIVSGLGSVLHPFRPKPAWTIVRDAALHWPITRFQQRFLKGRGKARKLSRRRYRVTLSGRFKGPACGGRLRLVFRAPGQRATTRAATVRRNCRYRRTVKLKVRRRSRGVRVSQRFLGNTRVGPGDAKRVRVRLPRR